jgi:hypothetical protein
MSLLAGLSLNKQLSEALDGGIDKQEKRDSDGSLLLHTLPPSAPSAQSSRYQRPSRGLGMHLMGH